MILTKAQSWRSGSQALSIETSANHFTPQQFWLWPVIKYAQRKSPPNPPKILHTCRWLDAQCLALRARELSSSSSSEGLSPTDLNKPAWGRSVYGLLNWKYCIVFGLSIRHLFHSQSQTLFTNRERPSTQPSVAKPTPTRHETNPKMGGGSCKYLLSICNIQTNTVKTRT